MSKNSDNSDLTTNDGKPISKEQVVFMLQLYKVIKTSDSARKFSLAATVLSLLAFFAVFLLENADVTSLWITAGASGIGAVCLHVADRIYKGALKEWEKLCPCEVCSCKRKTRELLGE